jgi:hypothetical protein
MKKLMVYTSFLALTLFLSGLPAYAGNIYHFNDKDGVSTLSKTLPPYAAQQGYEILDDKTLLVIKRVLSRKETIEQHKTNQVIAQQQQQEQLLKQQKSRLQKEQATDDKNFLDIYPSVEDIIRARDRHQAYIDKQIEDTTIQKSVHQQTLHKLQQTAAEKEFSGQNISNTLTQRIENIQKDIINNQLHFEKLQQEQTVTRKQYANDIARLKALLAISYNESLPLNHAQN